MGLIDVLLKKRGIEDTKELSPDERKQIDDWRRVLTEDITVAKIKEFCQLEVGRIESEWRGSPTDTEKNVKLIPYHTVYKTILSVIEAPENKKEALERYLKDLINS